MQIEEQKSRRRTPPIPVWCNPAERELIVSAAAGVGLSVSAYLRRIGLGYQPHSMIDLEKVEAMLKVSADAGRLGGLLKLWLTDDAKLDTFKGRDLRPVIQEALTKITAAQTEIRGIAETVLKNRRRV